MKSNSYISVRFETIFLLCVCILLFCNDTAITSDYLNPNIFDEISKMEKQDLLDINQTSLFKIYALLAPEKLPFKLKNIEYDIPWCGTPLILDIFRINEKLTPEVYNEIQILLLPEVPEEKLLDSDQFPIRIHYSSSLSSSYVDSVLSYVELSFQREVNEIGFIAPPPDGSFGGNDRFDLYLRDLPSGLGGYTAPINFYNDVNWFSYSSYCVINSDIPDGNSLKGTIAHEFNHSCQFSMDASETINIMEATATYMMNVVFPEDSSNIRFLPYFQREPFRSIDYYSSGSVYVYGAFLFIRFLSEFYDDNNPEFIRKIWEGTMQKEWANEPDYLDAIQSLVNEYKGHDFRDTYREFAKWRYFTGPNDDGEHFIDGNKYGYNSQVKIDKIFTSSDLPLKEWNSPNPPSEYGAVYIDFDLKDSPGALFLQFQGESQKAWSSDMILIPGNAPSTQYLQMITDYVYAGTLFVPDIISYEKTVLVVSNLSDGNHDPDNNDWNRSNFSLFADLVNGQEAKVFTDKKFYSIGDTLKADLITMNSGKSVEVNLVLALESNGNLFFYPDWSTEFNLVPVSLDKNTASSETFVNFVLEDENISGYYSFYSALLDKTTGELVSNLNRYLFGINVSAPKAVLKVNPEIGNLQILFTADASDSFDAQNPISVLQVRWDWENDGIWDTQYSISKVEYHNFKEPGLKTIKMEILDLDGFTGQDVKTIEVK
ncbi:hypothetical protein KKB18_10300 [bacterium]|nr:hypothetical protein [bacterium]